MNYLTTMSELKAEIFDKYRIPVALQNLQKIKTKNKTRPKPKNGHLIALTKGIPTLRLQLTLKNKTKIFQPSTHKVKLLTLPTPLTFNIITTHFSSKKKKEVFDPDLEVSYHYFSCHRENPCRCIFMKPLTIRVWDETVTARPNEDIRDVVDEIFHRNGRRRLGYDLEYEHKKIRWGDTFEDLGLTDSNTVYYFSPDPRVDIGVFREYDSNNIGALILRDGTAPQEEVRHIISEVTGLYNPRVEPPKLEQGILPEVNSEFRTKLRTYLAQHQTEYTDDFKVELSKDTLISLIGEQVFEVLADTFGVIIRKIILRRVSSNSSQSKESIDTKTAQSGECINFHLDFAAQTMQIPLSDLSEYSGGRTIYLLNSEIIIPKRELGTYTIHNHSIVHGVSCFESGIRSSLFLLG
jgi:hypothetical protein